jgi:hypothetical protein
LVAKTVIPANAGIHETCEAQQLVCRVAFRRDLSAVSPSGEACLPCRLPARLVCRVACSARLVHRLVCQGKHLVHRLVCQGKHLVHRLVCQGKQVRQPCRSMHPCCHRGDESGVFGALQTRWLTAAAMETRPNRGGPRPSIPAFASQSGGWWCVGTQTRSVALDRAWWLGRRRLAPN